ncbi:hypothetical protein [Rubrivirga sp. IMCC43871]|uniref:hypothetical protein n=1 Tax=Rubrivirga sp. IMCC43871 TaxID=3391575 RepID=UPI0039901F37
MTSRPLVPALAVVAALVWGYGALDPLVFAEAGVKYYGPMAEAAPGLDLGQNQPYVFRWLGPWLAGLLPLAVPTAFYVWAVVGSLALAALTYGVCRSDGATAGASALAVLLLAANPYLFGFNVFNMYQLGDLLAQLGLGAGLWLLWQRRYAALAVVLAVTVLAREPAILMAPVAAVYLWERRRLRQDGWKLALALVPVVVLFVVPRLLLTEQEGPHLVQTFLNASGKAADPGTWARLLVNAFVPAVAVLAVFPRETWIWMRGHLHLVALFGLTLASAFFGGDQERLMQPAIWAVYPAAAAVLSTRWRDRGATAVLMAAAALTSLHHITARFPLPDRRLTAVLAAVALALALGAALWVRAQGRTARTLNPEPRT